MEADFKPVAQSQRRLNAAMKEVVKKEVQKLLEAGMIYPISDSTWVSPMQMVPKKSAVTVIHNEKNELIPTKIVTGYEEGSFSSAIHGSDAGKVSRESLLLFSGWLFRL